MVRKLFIGLSLVVTIWGIFSICTFKILDRDFWWHIKAGEVMVDTGHLITSDPFAHTREGEPYVSSHQWLAQIIFYGVWNAGGATGEILFRGLLVATAFVVLLLIDRKRIWPNFILVLLVAYFNRPSFMDRPQLFSFLFFACFLYAAIYYLRRVEIEPTIKSRWRHWFLAALAGIQILWVNTHGAAAIYGMIIVCALIAERIGGWFATPSLDNRKASTGELKYVVFLLVALVGSSLLSPNTWHTFDDVFVYSSDQALALVREWQPRGTNGYLTDIAPFWVLAVIALVLGKRHRVFSVVAIAVMGYLSFQAYRHGMFFIFTVLALFIAALGDTKRYTAWISQALKKPIWSGGATIAFLVLMGWYMQYKNISVLQREGYAGFGISASAENAYDFIEREQLSGNMFNTYAIGDYLLYRGYPDRKVYIDGRTVDFGYDFIRETAQAGFDPAVWEKIVKKYDLTYAIIEYPLAPGASPENDLPYVVHLAQNKEWVLVYVDDKVAVYVRDIEQSKEVIQKYGYSLLTPEGLEFGKVFDGLEKDDIAKAEEEAERVALADEKGIKSKLLLAHHYVEAGNLEKAQQFASAAIDAQPYRPESYEALGVVAVGMKQWAQAGMILEKSIELTGGVGLPINYGYLADIFTNAGDMAKSSYYRQKAK